MTAYLVRHAHAGDRARWDGLDARRPISVRGVEQSAWLVEQLAHRRLGRLVSSPALRCVQTLEPLARSRRRSIERSRRLAEGHGSAGAISLLRSGDGVVLCTHGDVMEETLAALEEAGVRLYGGVRFAKGCIWTFDHADDGGITSGRYRAPSTRT